MARPRLGDSETKRLQMVITEDELGAIDAWQHANHISSRSEAIRRLCQIGLFSSRYIADLERLAMRISDWSMKASSSEFDTVRRAVFDAQPGGSAIIFDASELRTLSLTLADVLENSRQGASRFEEIERKNAVLGRAYDAYKAAILSEQDDM